MSIIKNFNRELNRGWALITILVIASLIISGCGVGQQAKVYKVGVLIGLDYAAPILDGFKKGMTDLGYVEGKNIVYDVQKSSFDMAAYQTILNKFVADKVDLIVVTPTEATQAAKKTTQSTNIPVVFCFAFTEGMGIIDSVRTPGGNITGVRFPGVDIAAKRFEILHELVPNAKRVLIPYQRGYPIVAPQIEAIRPLAQAAGITLVELPADNAAEVQSELNKLSAVGGPNIDAILTVAEPLSVSADVFSMLAKFSLEHKILFGGAYMAVGDYSSVYGVNVDFIQTGKLAAPLADKIFKGTSAGTIPAVSPDNYIQINYKLAQELGLTVPDGLLKQANEIIR